MIHLITGLPGDGKTLYTIAHVLERAEQERRPVFYSGIPKLAIEGWTEISDEAVLEWYDLPEGAIIVIDEAQRIFRPRSGRGEVPRHVVELETHRHHGHDLYLVTQHPALIDQNVRRLAGQHRHVVRKFGFHRATVHEWAEVHMDCEKRRTDSSRSTFKYPARVFELYQSATQHTHKVRLTTHVYYLIGGVLLLAFLIGFLYVRMAGRVKPTEEKKPTVESSQSGSGLIAIPSFNERQPENKTMTDDEYVASFNPRLPGLLHTAPRYDEVTKPTRAPYPVGCVVVRGRCMCYTDQATQLRLPPDVCMAILLGGYYVDFGERPSSGESPADSSPRSSSVKNEEPKPAASNDAALASLSVEEPPPREPDRNYTGRVPDGLFGDARLKPKLQPLL